MIVSVPYSLLEKKSIEERDEFIKEYDSILLDDFNQNMILEKSK